MLRSGAAELVVLVRHAVHSVHRVQDVPVETYEDVNSQSWSVSLKLTQIS